jgi:hypothetical protein
MVTTRSRAAQARPVSPSHDDPRESREEELPTSPLPVHPPSPSFEPSASSVAAMNLATSVPRRLLLEPDEQEEKEEQADPLDSDGNTENPPFVRLHYLQKPPPLRPYRRCAGCSQKTRADVWCCECARCLCASCDERRHATDALDALRRPMCSHRVELIVDGGGVPLLSSLLEIAVIVSAVMTLRPLLSAAGNMLNVEYFFESVCPIVRRVRLLVFRMDHALYPLVRGTLGAWCDTEDAFIKIFVDVWVRGILTRTDSFALLLMKIPMTLGALIIVLAITPLLAVPYAVVATIFRMLEVMIIPNWAVTRALARLARWINVFLWAPLHIAGWFARSTALGLIMDNEYRQHFHRRLKIPPKTGHRIRPTLSDGIEDISPMGALSRVTRVFVYFHRKARRTIVGAILTSVFVAVLVRVMLLGLPRCGGGILAATPTVQDLLHLENTNVSTSTADPTCVSVHALIRKYAQRMGVETPDFEDLGQEAKVLAKLQESTEDDYMDQILRLTVRTTYGHFMTYPMLIRVMLCAACLAFCSAGVLRRVLYWIDLHRRSKYSAAMHLKKEAKATKQVDGDGEKAEAPKDDLPVDDVDQEASPRDDPLLPAVEPDEQAVDDPNNKEEIPSDDMMLREKEESATADLLPAPADLDKAPEETKLM